MSALPPVIAPGVERSVNRLTALLDDVTQTVIRHRWKLGGAIFLTRDQLGQRLNLSVGEVRRIEQAGFDDLRSIPVKGMWL